jgi:hypothetical protein
LADLRPCPFNLLGTPQSWFDLFLSAEAKELLANLEEWQRVMASTMTQ